MLPFCWHMPLLQLLVSQQASQLSLEVTDLPTKDAGPPVELCNVDVTEDVGQF